MAYSNSWPYNGGYPRTLTLAISQTINSSSNTSTLNWSLTSSGSEAVSVAPTTVTINNTTVYSCPTTRYNSGVFPAINGSTGGSMTIAHKANGTVDPIPVVFSTNLYSYSPVPVVNTTISFSSITTYTLSTSAGTGSTITVNRTSSGYSGASTGNIASGTRVYYGDKLKISFGASTGYLLNAHTVNGSTFTSGNTHTVSGNVSVVSTANVAASTISATNANIGAKSTITVTRGSSSYTHTITYSFGSASGTIVTKSSSTSISWTVPTSLYAQIPNSKTGTCTLTCTTYSGNTSVGTKTCTLTLTATGGPTVNGTVVDVNSSTVSLTGNSSKLVKYKSTARCTITATGNNSASISTKKIAGTTVTSNTRDIANTTATSYEFYAADSRGYTATKTITPTMVNYVKLTNSPNAYRPTPTGSVICLTVSGNYFNGSFGASSNTLTVQYRWIDADDTGASWSSWEVADITVSSNTYKQSDPYITLGSDFDYMTTYSVQVKAQDELEDVTKTLTVKPGIPVFDWGKSDFNFNVMVNMHGFNTGNKYIRFHDERFTKGTASPDNWLESGIQFFDVNDNYMGHIGFSKIKSSDSKSRLLFRIYADGAGSSAYRQLTLVNDENDSAELNWNGDTSTFSGDMTVSGYITGKLSSESANGFNMNTYGNLVHKRANTSDRWVIAGNDSTVNFGVYYDTGNIISNGTITTGGTAEIGGALGVVGNGYFGPADLSATGVISVRVRNAYRQGALYVSGAGNLGLYDYTQSNWILYGNTSNETICPRVLKCTSPSGDTTASIHLGAGVIELYAPTPYIDFHYNRNSSDFTARIIESSSGTFSFMKPSNAYAPLYAASYNTGSSRRIKTDITPINEDDAEKLLLLEPSTFIVRGDDKRSAGLIAEDAYETLPMVVNMPDGYDEEEYSKKNDDEIIVSELPTINYQELIPYMIKLLQIQDARIKQLEEKE